MSLLDKFAAVEIKAESRISPVDKEYCAAYQEAYEHLRKSYKEILAFIEPKIKERVAILQRVEPGYTQSDFSPVSPSDIRNRLMESHKDFINQIVSYFSRKYNVTLDSHKIKELLLPDEPERGYYHRNEEEWNAYAENMYALTLTYEAILDQIFFQLGGCTFQDKAINELKEAAHCGAWNRYHGIKCFEQKKAVVSFTSYACHYDTWYTTRLHINLSDGMKAVVRAAAYFETGSMDYLPFGFRQLCDYSFDQAEFDLDMEKIKSVKCFKNGRVDIRFTSEAYAREFIEEYLGLEA